MNEKEWKEVLLGSLLFLLMVGAVLLCQYRADRMDKIERTF